MSLRLVPGLSAALLAGCWPHETRPLTEPESRFVDLMSASIAAHARRTQDPADGAVSRAIEDAKREGRILAFEDERRPDGELKQGAVVLGRLYLHASLLRRSSSMEGRPCPFPLMMLYHEGVHLTQSSCALLLAPESAEEDAMGKAKRFDRTWDPKGGR